jgi:outer membrane protein OmpA-like peptidoglycan-associated protein
MPPLETSPATRRAPGGQAWPALLGLALLLAAAAPGAGQAAVTKRKLGPNVNTDAREIGVAASPDGRFLYLTREDEPRTDAELERATSRAAPKDTCAQAVELSRKLPGSIPASVLERCATAKLPPTGGQPRVTRRRQTPQRIFVSTRQADGEWGPAVPLGLQSKAKQSTSIVTVLPDNNSLVVLGLFDDGRKECARGPGAGPPPADRCSPFWLARRRGDGWDPPTRLDVAFETGARRTTAALRPDRQAFLLDMKRPDGRGGRDLYVAMATGEQRFAAPINLGEGINTAANEAAPTLAADGKTLYFASDRPGGQGGYDLYVSRRLDDSWQRWSPPQNLGPEINTPADEGSISLEATGRFAYLITTDPESREDVWEFALPVEQRPAPVAFVYGTVRDPAGKPVGAGIAYERLADGRAAGRASADLQRGEYQLALPIGVDYGFRATAAGYVAVADRLDLRAVGAEVRVQRDLLLVPLEPGRTIRLANLFFEFNAAEPLPESGAELARLVALLGENPRLRIRIEAHTDAVGAPAANRALSEARAAAVRRHLQAARVDPARVEVRGFGETSPDAPNDTEEGRARNRRVEFRVLSL